MADAVFGIVLLIILAALASFIGFKWVPKDQRQLW